MAKMTRRNLLGKAPVLASLWFTADASFAAGKKEEEVSPAEDLMREHGVLNRILLIYDEISNRLEQGRDFPDDALSKSRSIIRSFVEDYHERLEEQHLFPRFEKAKTQLALVSVLRDQHNAGRLLTDLIESSEKLGDKKSLAKYLHLFVRMYRPHEAREDTVLFPAFRRIVSEAEYRELGEQFEDKEHELFGKDGFEKNVATVDQIEEQLDIYDLADFTAKVL